MNTYYRCTQQHRVASRQLAQLSSTTDDDSGDKSTLFTTSLEV